VIKINFNTTVKGLLPLFFLILILGCKKESTEIGVNLIGDGGIQGTLVEYTNISARSVPGDSFASDIRTYNLLGVINDPVFGMSKANLIVQPMLTQLGNKAKGKTIDSVKLVLRYRTSQIVGATSYTLKYGDVSSEMIFDIYKAAQKLSDSVYSNYKPTLGDKIGTYQGAFNFTDSTSLDIKLDNSFGQSLIDLDDASYLSNTAFLEALKGIVIVPRSTTVTGEGAIVAFNVGSNISKLLLYYPDTSGSASIEIPMGAASKRINYYETVPSASIAAQHTATNGSFAATYVQALGGSKIKIEVPELDSIIKKGGNVVINQAKISFVIDQTQTTSAYKEPARLFLRVPLIANKAVSADIIDLFSAYYGGTNSSGRYDFYFNRYLQALVKEYATTGVNSFNGFYLSIPEDLPIIPYRAVVKSDKSLGDIKVSVRYTKLD
jgi:hypothetical protein